MKLAGSQRGIGLWGMLLVFGVIGFASICVIKIGPLYLQHQAIVAAINAVAADPDSAEGQPAKIRTAIQRRLDIEDVSVVSSRDVKIEKGKRGKALAIKYEARRNLFSNIDVVLNFEHRAEIRR